MPWSWSWSSNAGCAVCSVCFCVKLTGNSWTLKQSKLYVAAQALSSSQLLLASGHRGVC